MKTIIPILAAILLAGCQDSAKAKKYYQPTYSAWLKAHPETHLTFDEWYELYRHELLPGQRFIRAEN